MSKCYVYEMKIKIYSSTKIDKIKFIAINIKLKIV